MCVYICGVIQKWNKKEREENSLFTEECSRFSIFFQVIFALFIAHFAASIAAAHTNIVYLRLSLPLFSLPDTLLPPASSAAQRRRVNIQKLNNK